MIEYLLLILIGVTQFFSGLKYIVDYYRPKPFETWSFRRRRAVISGVFIVSSIVLVSLSSTFWLLVTGSTYGSTLIQINVGINWILMGSLDCGLAVFNQRAIKPFRDMVMYFFGSWALITGLSLALESS